MESGPTDGHGAVPARRVLAPPGESLRLERLDGDSDLDLVAQDREEMRTQTLRLYRNRDGYRTSASGKSLLVWNGLKRISRAASDSIPILQAFLRLIFR